MTTRFRSRALGVDLDLPPGVLDAPSARAFRDHLVAHADMDPPTAERFTLALMAAAFGRVADDWSRRGQARLARILDLRAQLRTRYRAALAALESGPGQHPAFAPEGIRDLFNQLAEELDGFERPSAALDRRPEIALVADLADVEALARAGRSRGPDTATTPEAVAPIAEVFDPVPRDRDRPPPVHAQERVERLGYSERLAAQGEDLAARGRAQAAADAWAVDALPEGWDLHLRRIPDYGASAAARRGLRPLDPRIAGEGYEVVLVSPTGKRYMPDGVVQAPNGRGFLLAEWKEPLGDRSRSWYASPEGREALIETMVERAAMSRELPGCGGWVYDTGVPWMDELLVEAILQIRESPATADLGRRIIGPSAWGR